MSTCAGSGDCSMGASSQVGAERAAAVRGKLGFVPGPLTFTRSSMLGMLGMLVGLSGCWQAAYYQTRNLHYVDGALVETQAPAAAAYEAYLRARLALERSPAQLDEARGHILDALRWQPDEPQLWTVKAEIEWKAGDFAAAERDLARALELRPGYAEAQRLLVQVRDRGGGATAAASPNARRPPVIEQ